MIMCMSNQRRTAPTEHELPSIQIVGNHQLLDRNFARSTLGGCQLHFSTGLRESIGSSPSEKLENLQS